MKLHRQQVPTCESFRTSWRDALQYIKHVEINFSQGSSLCTTQCSPDPESFWFCLKPSWLYAPWWLTSHHHIRKLLCAPKIVHTYKQMQLPCFLMIIHVWLCCLLDFSPSFCSFASCLSLVPSSPLSYFHYKITRVAAPPVQSPRKRQLLPEGISKPCDRSNIHCKHTKTHNYDGNA